jgi:uncharacterized protein YxjI
VTGIELLKLYFQIRACYALTSAFDKIAGTKKIAGKRFFAVKRFFCRQMLFLQANTFFAGNAFHQKNSQQRESFKLHISRRWWPEEEQPIPHKTRKRVVHESKSN